MMILHLFVFLFGYLTTHRVQAECAGPCGGDGTCTINVCTQGCMPGYHGESCEHVCTVNCGGDGSCNATSCTYGCKPGYFGNVCEHRCLSSCITTNIDHCDDEFSCSCKTGWKGSNCDVDVDECEANPELCPLPHSLCVNQNGSYYCRCDDGYHDPSGQGCEEMPPGSSDQQSSESSSDSTLAVAVGVAGAVAAVVIAVVVACVCWYRRLCCCQRPKTPPQQRGDYDNIVVPVNPTKQEEPRPSIVSYHMYQELMDFGGHMHYARRATYDNVGFYHLSKPPETKTAKEGSGKNVDLSKDEKFRTKPQMVTQLSCGYLYPDIHDHSCKTGGVSQPSAVLLGRSQQSSAQSPSVASYGYSYPYMDPRLSIISMEDPQRSQGQGPSVAFYGHPHPSPDPRPSVVSLEHVYQDVQDLSPTGWQVRKVSYATASLTALKKQ